MKKFILLFIMFFSICGVVNAKSVSDDTDISRKEEIYYKINTFLDSNGNVLLEDEIKISEDEYKELEKELTSSNNCSDGKACYKTNMKKIAMYISGSKNNCDVNLKVSYFNMPEYRSYDVIAMRWSGFQMDSFNGLQKGIINNSENRVVYNSSSENAKIGTNGIGISMNLYDDATYLELSLSINGKITGNSMSIYGTYQHAQGNLTLSQSKSYSFSSSGLGKVLYYSNSSIRNMYDNMDGVEVLNFNF